MSTYKKTSTLPHTAAATWSGFIYQGRVALYHVVSILSQESEAEINRLSLQIDSIEDFTILRDNDKVNPVSIHQVKALSSKQYSTYKESFETLASKKNEICENYCILSPCHPK